MSEINGRARPVDSGDEPPRRGLRGRLALLRALLQDRLWSSDEKWAADRGYDTWRSPAGWTVHVRNPRFDLRQECDDCGGEGRDPITGRDCPGCDGTGVVTLDPPEDGDVR